MLIRDSSSGLARASAALGQRLGYSNDELAREPLLHWIHPEDTPRARAALAAGSGIVQLRHATRSGSWLALTLTVRTDGHSTQVVGWPSDSLATPEPERDPMEAYGDSMAQMLRRMALIVEGKNPGHRCSILLVNAHRTGITVGAGPSIPTEYHEALEGMAIGPFVGSCGAAVYWNLPVVVEDVTEDPLWRDLLDVAAIAGVKACWSQPIRGASGEVLGALALYSDEPSSPTMAQMDGLEIAAHMVGVAIERERLEAQLRQKAKFEALGVLAGGVAHDFNNLLAVIVGNAELALATDAVAQSSLGMIQDIIRAAEGATGICNQMLTCAGRGYLTTESIECAPLIRELSQLLQVSLSKKAVLRLDLENDLRVLADGSQLRQVLMNLITNGAEAVGHRDGEVTVSTRSIDLTSEVIQQCGLDPDLTPGQYVEIAVRDTGCGMDAETSANIFDPFFSTKDDGRGLGLAAVMGIVRAHGWALTVKSVPGRGTTFVVLAPRCRHAARKAPQAAVPAPASGTRVLVIDDEPGVLKVVAGILKQAGMDVRTAAHGAEGVEVYREHHGSIDCVILDMNMPILDGEETFVALRAIRPDARVLLMSGYAEQNLLDRFRGAGLAGVLQKPIRAATLLREIAAVVPGHVSA
ncbi:Blue-light-activated protein [Planctomycetes bacterium Poly30]|uniref:histidine kinase n=2 Tax=Saltatorellus ferox TaxID=2528018 RepID=A0A518ES63_9BACT|nr:Blue-light-activated protein [Planctomycetes bacterium Poly30]